MELSWKRWPLRWFSPKCLLIPIPFFIEARKVRYLIHKLTTDVNPLSYERKNMPPFRSQVTPLDMYKTESGLLLWASQWDGSSDKPGRLVSTHVSEGHQRKCLLLCETINCLSRTHPLTNKPVKQHARNKLINISAHDQRAVKLGLEPVTPDS